MAKIFPEYIPKPIRNDYEEACAIVESSPKASATLSRRCLQGMIRDFWNISGKANLYQEIDAIKEKVDRIIDVDTNEAETLIDLIEMVLEEWYIRDHKKKERIAKTIGIGNNKRFEKKS